MHCCLWFRSVFRVRGPWPKRYGYHLSIIYNYVYITESLVREIVSAKFLKTPIRENCAPRKFGAIIIYFSIIIVFPGATPLFPFTDKECGDVNGPTKQ